MSYSIKPHWLFALSLLGSLPAISATVYKTVDDNGVVTYSDTKPADHVAVETLEIDVVESPQNDQAQQRLQDMRDTTDRMAADRMAREKHRAEIRELDAQAAAQQASQDVHEDDDYDDYDHSPIYTGYGDYPMRGPWRPSNRPRPEHPIVHPPLLPPEQPSYDYPASLIRKSYPPNVRKVFR